MKYKSNSSLSFVLEIVGAFISTMPFLIIFSLATNDKDFLWFFLKAMPVSLGLAVILLSAIKSITLIFIKPNLYIYDDKVVCTNSAVSYSAIEMYCESEVKFDEISYIGLDYGNRFVPSRLEIYNRYNDLVMVIKKPSIIPTVKILRRSKYAIKKIIPKWFIILNAITYPIAAIVLTACMLK